MNPTAPLALLERLAAMPGELRRAAADLGSAGILVPAPGGGFCFVELVWHLADLELEGFGARIDLLLREREPFLPDFDGAGAAVARDYKSKPLEPALAAFESARRDNLSRLRSVAPPDWERSGTQQGVGRVTLADLPRLMLEHDDSHRQELTAILASVRSR